MLKDRARAAVNTNGGTMVSETGNCAGTPSGPIAFFAVPGAFVGVADFAVHKFGASISAVGSILLHEPGAALHTTSTTGGAGSPRFPVTNGAIIGAGLTAGTLLPPRGAVGAAECSVLGHIPDALLNMTAAAGGACIPLGPSADGAVDGASVLVAFLRLFLGWTDLATECGFLVNGTMAKSDATATRY